MTVTQFYRDYVSKSLPCVLRGDILQSQLFKEMRPLQGTELDSYLIERFTGDIVDYYSLSIDQGWFIRATRTKTKEWSLPIDQYLEDKNQSQEISYK